MPKIEQFNLENEKETIDIPVILPSLNPTEKLLETIDGLLLLNFKTIIVINDGSDSSYDIFFDQIAKKPECILLKHSENKGKGAALKTAFTYMKENMDIRGFVTADADGQHLPEDILKCVLAMNNEESYILGSRDFSQPQVPVRSFLGNRITSLVFRISCKMDINDTQTGLRAFPVQYIPLLLSIEGDRFEYETNMLLEFQNRNIPFKEVTITTVYEDNNEGSHFNPIRDAFRIYGNILKFLFGSITAFIIDNLCFLGLFYLFNKLDESFLRILISMSIARLISSFFNFTFNKKRVFQYRKDYKKSLFRYYSVTLLILLLSWSLVSLTGLVLGELNPLILLSSKIVIEAFLFILSYFLQKKWVFKTT